MSNNTSTITKNTILLYGRSLIMMILAILTSRVLLKALGVEDYGIYNVVGGVVAMFTSIKSVMASSVQRFMNFYKGKNDINAVNVIFIDSICIHLVIAIVFGVLIEIFGLWFIQNQLILPDGRYDAAIFVFHCSVIATIITILTIPYDSAVIANQKMDFYSYISIADAGFKLGIIFIIPYIGIDDLKGYGLLVLLITVFLRLATLLYCRRFEECKLSIPVKNKFYKEISKFSGWNFLGCTASSLIEEGSNFILNTFGGVVANAARGIAYQVRSAIVLLSNNVVVASQPYIMQQAAVVDRQKFFTYIYFQTRIIFYIVCVTIIPLYLYSSEILSLWLVQVPLYANEFMRAILIYMLVMTFQKSLDIAFKSYGNIAKYQVLDTAIALTTLPIAYLVLYLKAPLHYVFYVFSLIRVLDYVAVLYLAQYQIQLSISDYFRNVIIPCLKSFLIAIIIILLFSFFLKPSNIALLFIYAMLSIILYMLALHALVLNNKEKEILNQIIYKIKNKSR